MIFAENMFFGENMVFGENIFFNVFIQIPINAYI